MKRTPWFKFPAAPVRDGVYEVVYYGDSSRGPLERRLWLRGTWFQPNGSECAFWMDGDKWRGLTEPAK
jgi:hypothetical protein